MLTAPLCSPARIAGRARSKSGGSGAADNDRSQHIMQSRLLVASAPVLGVRLVLLPGRDLGLVIALSSSRSLYVVYDE